MLLSVFGLLSHYLKVSELEQLQRLNREWRRVVFDALRTGPCEIPYTNSPVLATSSISNTLYFPSNDAYTISFPHSFPPSQRSSRTTFQSGDSVLWLQKGIYELLRQQNLKSSLTPRVFLHTHTTLGETPGGSVSDSQPLHQIEERLFLSFRISSSSIYGLLFRSLSINKVATLNTNKIRVQVFIEGRYGQEVLLDYAAESKDVESEYELTFGEPQAVARAVSGLGSLKLFDSNGY